MEDRIRKNPPQTPSIDIVGAPPGFPASTLAKFAAEVLDLCNQGRVGLCVALISDSEIRKLNREFRNIDAATDVLSFPGGCDFPSDQKYLGDIAISLPAARRQAAQLGHSELRELLILLAHGIIHLSGFDHERDSGEMAHLEKTVKERIIPRYC